MRVSILVDFLRPNGAGLMALLQGQLLRDAGHDVSFIAAAASDEISSAIAESGIRISAFLHSEQPFDRTLSPRDFLTLREDARQWMQNELTSQNADILCVHNCGRLLDQHMVSDLSRQLPVVMTVHDEWFLTDAHYRLNIDSELVRSFEPHRDASLARHRYEHLDEVSARAGNLTIIAPSSWLFERCRRRFPGLRCIHLRNPVDPQLFDAMGRTEARSLLGVDQRVPLVMAVGNPREKRKGLGHLAQSMNLVEGNPILLVVGGSSSYVGQEASSFIEPGCLQAVLDENRVPDLRLHGYQDRAIAVGGCPRSMMRLLYAAADVVAHPSVMDNLPTVPIEAGLVGVRCLATDVGGTSETIADADGLFPHHASAEFLADRLAIELRRSRDETAEVRSERRKRQLHRFSPERHLELLEPLLESLVSK
ncbi:MAG: glycosyltransferase [Ilumatobacter sp.]|uniref:glycosyltransferase n=1 Tax=Ilumatobacter sp. TaxID=1967498 RepID=UPI00391BDFF6